jgi:arginine-tRNA-protein transferase
MRYKGDYHPTYMLDPDSYQWDLLDDGLKKKLDEGSFVSLSRERAKGDASSRKYLDAAESQSSEGVTDVQEENSDTEMREDIDSDEEPPVPNPNAPLWERDMPGVLTKNQLLTEIDLDQIKLQIDGNIYEARMLVSWDSSSIDNIHSAKGAIAELVAAMGIDIAKEVVLSF